MRGRAACSKAGSARDDRFTLGVCNGCQMLAALSELIPGAAGWPRFRRNRSEQFEGRLSLVEIVEVEFTVLQRAWAGRCCRSPSRTARVARNSGTTRKKGPQNLSRSCASRTIADARRLAYPANPNGSPGGIAGLTSRDGRVTILMPHPERVFRTVQNSWHPKDAGEDSGWMRMFRNARVWVG